MRLMDFKDDIEVRAYVIYVFHRWRSSNEMVHIKNEYVKRMPDEIQQMENVRQNLHKGAMNFLKTKGFTEKEISIFLENECEKETKRTLPELEEGECYCGCCRIKIKNKDFGTHTSSDKLHKTIDEPVYEINMFYRMAGQYSKMQKAGMIK